MRHSASAIVGREPERDTKRTSWIYNDGGRKAAGFKGEAGDCAARAIAIAMGHPYREVYDRLNSIIKDQPLGGRRKHKTQSAREGVYREHVHAYVQEHGWEWVPTMKVGAGCTVHARADELPQGRLILRVSKHFVACADGVIHDTFDSTREGTRCVYGYWKGDNSLNSLNSQEDADR